MIVGGNKVYLLTPFLGHGVAAGGSMSIEHGGREAGRQPSSQLEEALNLSSSDAVT